MAPLDSEQISQVKELIREGTNEAFAASQRELLREKTAIEKTQSDIVETTEKAVLTQQGLAQELERKIRVINEEMESRCTAGAESAERGGRGTAYTSWSVFVFSWSITACLCPGLRASTCREAGGLGGLPARPLPPPSWHQQICA